VRGSAILLKARMHGREKRHLVSLCLSVRPSVCISAAPTERVSVKFDIGDLCVLCPEDPDFVKIRRKHQAPYIKT
jgi:hypothetical protein